MTSSRPATAPGATTPLPEAEAVVQFWRRHARVGTGLSAVVLAQIALYGGFAAKVPHRTMLFVLVVAGTVVTAGAAVLAPLAVRRGWFLGFYYAWSFCAVAVVLTACATDGGAATPITATLFLPLLFAALAYPPTAVLWLGIATAVGYSLVAVTGDHPSPSTVAVIASTLLIAAVMAARSARYRDDQRQRLHALASRLRDDATRDELTGALNRRGFDAAIDAEVARAARHRRPLALLLVDVDHLKDINDVGGHAAGDAALAAVAVTLAGVSRTTDIVARIGGDEFAVLLPETSVRDAARLAGRIHDDLLQTAPGVTISIGVAELAQPGASRQLVDAADTALYDAKRAGRNCSRVFGSTGSSRSAASPTT